MCLQQAFLVAVLQIQTFLHLWVARGLLIAETLNLLFDISEFVYLVCAKKLLLFLQCVNVCPLMFV